MPPDSVFHGKNELLVFEMIVFGSDHINDQRLIFVCYVIIKSDLIEQSE